MKHLFLFLAIFLFASPFWVACEKQAVKNENNAEAVAATNKVVARPAKKAQMELQALEQRENQLRDEVQKLAQTMRSTQASLNESIRAIERDLAEIEQQRKRVETAFKQAEIQQGYGAGTKRHNWPWPLRIALALVVAGAVVLLYRRLVHEQGSETAWVEDGHIEENEWGAIHYPERMYDTQEDSEDNPDRSDRDSH
jgi:hypothetical protein